MYCYTTMEKEIKSILNILSNKKKDLHDRPESPYNPPEKDMSSVLSIIPKAGIFAKEKERDHSKAVWEFYMLFIWNKILSMVMKKNHNIGINIKSPKPSHIEVIDHNKAKIYMQFMSGVPIKSYSSRSKQDIKKNIIKIKHRKKNVLEAIIYEVGALCKVKEDYYLFHGDIDLRHLMFDRKTKTIAVVDFEKSLILFDEIKDKITKYELEKAIKFETDKILKNLGGKLGHIIDDYDIHKSFYKGYNEIGAKKGKNGVEYLSTILKQFKNNYGDTKIGPPEDVIKRVKEVVSNRFSLF